MKKEKKGGYGGRLCWTKWVSIMHFHVCLVPREPMALFASRIWRVRYRRVCPSGAGGRRPKASLKTRCTLHTWTPTMGPQGPEHPWECSWVAQAGWLTLKWVQKYVYVVINECILNSSLLYELIILIHYEFFLSW